MGAGRLLLENRIRGSILLRLELVSENILAFAPDNAGTAKNAEVTQRTQRVRLRLGREAAKQLRCLALNDWKGSFLSFAFFA